MPDSIGRKKQNKQIMTNNKKNQSNMMLLYLNYINVFIYIYLYQICVLHKCQLHSLNYLSFQTKLKSVGFNSNTRSVNIIKHLHLIEKTRKTKPIAFLIYSFHWSIDIFARAHTHTRDFTFHVSLASFVNIIHNSIESS